MLNNKKSLLQRARIAMVAIVTIMGIGGAFAMNAPKLQAATTYGVIATNANTYSVTALGPHSKCNASSSTCEVRSSAPLTGGTIPKMGATVLQEGTFVK